MNSQSRVAMTWLAVAIAAAAGMVLPSALGADMMRRGYAISLVSGMLFITAVIVVIVFWRRSVALSRILSGTGLLAHWHYDADTWARHLEEQYGDRRSGNRSLLIVLAAISLGIGLLFLVADPDAGRYVLLVMVALVAVCAVAAFAAPWLQRRHNLAASPEARVGLLGALVGSDLHLWRSFGARVDAAAVEDGSAPCLVVRYSQFTRTGRQEYEVAVPIPSGEEQTAERVAAAILDGHVS